MEKKKKWKKYCDLVLAHRSGLVIFFFRNFMACVRPSPPILVRAAAPAAAAAAAALDVADGLATEVGKLALSDEIRITVDFYGCSYYRYAINSSITVAGLRASLRKEYGLLAYDALLKQVPNGPIIGAHPREPATLFEDDRTLFSYGLEDGARIAYIQFH